MPFLKHEGTGEGTHEVICLVYWSEEAPKIFAAPQLLEVVDDVAMIFQTYNFSIDT